MQTAESAQEAARELCARSSAWASESVVKTPKTIGLFTSNCRFISAFVTELAITWWARCTTRRTMRENKRDETPQNGTCFRVSFAML